MKWTYLLPASLIALAACGETDTTIAEDARDDSFMGAGGPADSMGISENSETARAVLEVVNTLDLSALDDDVALDARAASAIVAARVGTDRTLFTADDVRIGTLRELDAVPWTGSRAFARLIEYASGIGVAHGTVHGIQEGSTNAQIILTAANTLSFTQLDDDAALDARAAHGIVDGRPFANLGELDAAPYVGERAFRSLLDFGRRHTGTGTDPFDPSLANAPSLTEAEAIAFFAPGESQVHIADFEFSMRTRQCNELTGCGQWAVQPHVTFDHVTYQRGCDYGAGWAGPSSTEQCPKYKSGRYEEVTGELHFTTVNGDISVRFDSDITGEMTCAGSVTQAGGECSGFAPKEPTYSKQRNCTLTGYWDDLGVSGFALALPDIYEDRAGAGYPVEAPTDRALTLNMHVTAGYTWGHATYASKADEDGNYTEVEYAIYASY